MTITIVHGARGRNAKYHIQFLYDSINDLDTINNPGAPPAVAAFIRP